MRRYLGSFILLFSFWSYGQLIINELQSSNDRTLEANDGSSYDWIEIYNSSSQSIPLNDYYLSDDSENPTKWKFPNIRINPKEYLVVFASGLNGYFNGKIHTSFRLSRAGEDVVLANSAGVIVQEITFPMMITDASYAATPNHSTTFQVTYYPTPSEANDVLPEGVVVCNVQSGFYTENQKVVLQTGDTSIRIYYTLDGREPTVIDDIYTAPIILGPRSKVPVYGHIPTTPLSGPSQLDLFIWRSPAKTEKLNTLRFAGFKNGERVTPVETRAVFVGGEGGSRYQFPVLSIVTDSLKLFDHDTGIYIPGAKHDIYGFSFWPIGNHSMKGRDWERKASLSYLDKDGNFQWSSNVGLRIRGNGSASFPQKSFGVYFRNEYGQSNIDYPFFSGSNLDSYKRIVLRNSGNDFLKTHFRDAMIHSLLDDFDLEYQQSSPSIVFINGEYWGIYNIREKLDQHYYGELVGVESDSIDIVTGCGVLDHGDNSDYLDLMEYLKEHSLAEATHYQYVSDRVDIDNAIDYFIAQIYTANSDWPFSNMKLWRPRVGNAKWRFVLFDLDITFNYDNSSGHWVNSFENAIDTIRWPNSECGSRLFRKLLENQRFVDKLVSRFAYHLRQSFDHKLVISRINEMASTYAPEIEEQIERWGYPEDYEEWELQVNALRRFAAERPCVIEDYLKVFFDKSTIGYGCQWPLDGMEGHDIFVSPNPVMDNTLIVMSIFQNFSEGNYQIFDRLGRVIIKGRLGSYPLQVDVSSLINGTYIIQVDKPDGRASAKFVVMHR